MEIISEFSQRVRRLTNLLKENNILWASELCSQLITEIELNTLSHVQKKIHVEKLIQAWQNYIGGLLGDFGQNWPLIYSSFYQLFELLLQIQESNRITDNGIRLVKTLIKINFATKKQIGDLLESLAILTFKATNLKKAIQLIFLALFFRRSVIRNKYFDICFQHLEQILVRLTPEERPILLDCLLMNTYSQFFQDSNEIPYAVFIKELYHLLVSSTGKATQQSILGVKNSSSHIDFSGKQRSVVESLSPLKQTIFHLQILNLHSWAFTLVKYNCERLYKQNKLSEIFTLLNHSLAESFQHGAYQTAYDLYLEMEKLLLEQQKGDLFPTDLAKFWTETTEKFRGLTNKSYYVTLLNRFKKITKDLHGYIHSNKEFQNYLYAVNEYYKLIRGYIIPSKQLFWCVVFFRAVYEEGLPQLAQMSAEHLSILNNDVIKRILGEDINYTVAKKKEQQMIGNRLDIGDKSPIRIKMKLHIPEKSNIRILHKTYYEGGYTTEEYLDFSEYWDEPYLERLYGKLKEFGQLAYLFLPFELRRYFGQLHVKSNHHPEVLVLQKEPSYPLEMIDDGKALLGTKFAFGYRFGELSLSHEIETIESEKTPGEKKYNVLSIGDINEEMPKIWNEKKNLNESLIPFEEGVQQSRFIATLINKTLKHLVENFHSINTQNCDLNSIQTALTAGTYHIIHIAANLFYLEDEPSESYFLTSDNKALSFNTINEMLSYAKKHNEVQKIPFIRPFFIFDGRIVNINKNLNVNIDSNADPSQSLKSTSKIYEIEPTPFYKISQIASSIGNQYINGFLSRINLQFNNITLEFLKNFLERILMGETIGSALLTANRRIFLLARKMQRENPDAQDSIILHNTQYILFGDPFFNLRQD